MKTRDVLISLTVSVALIGCTSVMHSNRVGTSAGKTAKQLQGIAYSLPKILIHLEAQLTNVLVTNINNKFPLTTVDTWTTNQVTTNAVPNSGTTNTFNSVTVRVAATNLNYTVTAKSFYAITLTEATVPDPNYLYCLKLSHQAQSSDNFGVNISSNGFITSINVTNDDKSGEIIKKIAETAIELYKVANGGKSTMDTNGTELEARDRIDLYFDPTDSAEIAKVNNLLGKAAKISATRPVLAGGVCYESVQTTNKSDGIFYRPKQSWVIELTNKYEIIRKVMLLPNKAPIMSFDVTRAFFVKKTSQVALVDGFPTQVAIDNPSELEAIVQVPLDIVKSVAAIPTNLVQLKIDYSSANQRLLIAQKAEIDAMTNLLAAQQRLLEIQATNKQTTANTNK